MKRICIKCGLNVEKDPEVLKKAVELELPEGEHDDVAGDVLIYICEKCFFNYLDDLGFEECEKCARVSNDIVSVETRPATMYSRGGDPGDPAEYAELCQDCAESRDDYDGPEYERD